MQMVMGIGYMRGNFLGHGVHIFLPTLLATAVLQTPAFAKNDKVERGPQPEWVTSSELLPIPAETSGLVFVRNQDTLVRLDDKGQLVYHGFRMKLLHPNALELGNIAISWNPASGAPMVHTIKVYRDGEAVDVLSKTTFEILRRENRLEVSMLTGTLTAVARVPDLRVGDELEFAYTIRISDPTLGKNDAGFLILPASTSLGRFRMGLSWTDGQQPQIKMTNDMDRVAQKGNGAIDFRFDNPVTLTPANDAPPRYNWQRVVEYSDFSDWGAVSRHFAPLYANAAKLPNSSPLKLEAARIASAHSTPIAQVSAALNLVQQDVRYIYVGLDGGNLKPATADETWQRRYGDCKGKTALLLALLNELGIEAEVVLVNNAGGDDGLNERLPSPQMFDHVLIRTKIDDQFYYLDGTLPPVVAPSKAPIFPYRWLLPLSEEGKSLEPLEWRAPSVPDEITLFEIDATAGFTEPSRITRTTIARGIEGLKQQVQFSAVTPAELFTGIRQGATGDTWQSIDDVKWRYDQKARASVLTISGTGAIDWEDDGGGSKSLAMPGGGFSPPSKRIRAADQDQNLPYFNSSSYTCSVTTVRIPSNTNIDQWASESGFDTRLFGRNYYRAFDFRGNAVRMVRGSRIEQQEIDASTAKRDNDRIASFDNSMAMIYYDPSAKNYGATGQVEVPATDEIDWSAEDVPCLSSASKK